MARELSGHLPKNADEKAKLAALNQYFFTERGFHGSRADYYNRANSYLNEVLDDREGLPITLSVLYIELARRVGLKMVGVGLPGHFIVRHVPATGEAQLIDVYEGGQPLSRADAERKVRGFGGQPLKEEHLAAVSKRAILVRMLRNLLGIAQEEEDARSMSRYIEVILMLAPEAIDERLKRAALRYQAGQRQQALEDIDWLIEHRSEGLDIERVLELRRQLSRP
jgi:regulator of sirC expression with transglutaminase-like and TPR domain